MQNARGTRLLPALALGGDEEWQQDRMPHCLKESLFFLIPRALSSRQKQRPCAPLDEHMASLQHSRGSLWMKPWRQGAVTKGEEKDSEKKGTHGNPAEKRAPSPLYNQAPELLLFPLAVASLFSLMHDHELLCRSQAPLSHTKVSGHKTPAAGVTAPVPFSGTGGRKSKMESKYLSPFPCKEVGKRPAFQKQSALGLHKN
ncbi:hypothetical protein P7K49_011499 [Saguinus oedipus]|uniref:Uncharacterized protein n=1 Tax=Saguinus oedipus TaxID=9490 RepID=A0ABQ9VQT5_SAGOE|nr:hypothetical protein P7K49_011499 [Saguinus oedipus]